MSSIERYGYGRLEYSAEQGAFHIEPEGGPPSAKTNDRWVILATRMQINILEDFSNYALAVIESAKKRIDEGPMIYAFYVWIHEDCQTMPNKKK
jgi:hypothetical protein